MERTKMLAGAAVAALIAAPAAVLAQNQTQEQPQQMAQEQEASSMQQSVAEKCLADLRDTVVRIQEDEYWISGWGSRWGYGVGAPAATAPAPGAAAPAGTAPATGTAAPADPALADGTMGSPWRTDAATIGMMSPRFQVSALYSAANVLAHRGDEEGCQYVLSELNTVYEDHVSQLREAGVEPGEVTTWRQEQIALAQPVSEMPRQFLSADNLSGMSVRNLQDERLGSVDDVILSKETGAISHLVVEYGGFLGIGTNHVLVPWEAFSATPGLNVLVLNVTEEELQNAPEVDPDRFSDAEVFAGLSEEADSYWERVVQ